MKFIIVLRIFAFMLFVFLPAIGVTMFAAFVLKSTWHFQWLGLPALFVNALLVFVQPGRRLIARQLGAIAKMR
jgi:hypothetical protein